MRINWPSTRAAIHSTIEGMPMTKPVRSFIVTLAVLILAISSVGAIAASNPVLGYSVDLPIGWADAGSSDPYHVGFLAPRGDAMIQIIGVDEATGDDGTAVAQFMLEELSATGETAPYIYLERSAALTDVTFMTNGNEARGYMVTIDGIEADLIILAFSLSQTYEANHDSLLSAIDSFALGDVGRLVPGPISQFYYPFPAPSPTSRGIPFVGIPVPFAVDPGEHDATQVLVEREARILAPYGALERPVFENAWRRFFRLIYRDNFERLRPLAEAIDERLTAHGTPRVDYPHEILSWLQGFEFQRTGGLSDFLAPISCITSESGDCDSLAMTYAILLHHLDFDAILMVSDRHAHALAAVDTFGSGARFEFEGRQWLVAEMTTDVDLGRIAADMADPAGWIGVRLRLRQL